MSATSAVAERPSGRAPKFSIADIPSVWSYRVSVTWLVEDLIPEGCITLLSGDSGVGKSTVALSLAGAVAHGAPFLGLATSHRRVLYVDRENPLAVIKERLRRLQIPETEWLTYWGLWVDPYPAGPGDAAIMRFVRDHRPLIIFDSLVAFHSGSEQDASETRAHMQLYRRLATAGATPLLLHHTGKSESARQYRGSSDIKAAVDCAYLIESQSGADEIRSLSLRCYKSRLTPGRTLNIAYSEAGGFTRVTRAETVTHAEALPAGAGAQAIIRALLGDGVSRNQTRMLSELQARGIAKNQALDDLRDAVAAETITVSVGKRRNEHIYALRGDVEVRL